MFPSLSSVMIRFASVAFVLSALLLLPPFICVLLFIIMGMAHITLAFWYQRGAGRWKMPAMLLFLLSYAAIAFMVHATSATLFFTITGIYTAYHMASDEVHLLKGKHSLFTVLEYTPFVVLYAGLLIDGNFHTKLFIPTLIVSGVALAVYVILSLVRRRTLNAVSYINLSWCVFGLLVYISTLGAHLVVVPFLWPLALAVLHYLTWYGEYAKKVADNPERRKTYYTRVFLVNGLFVAGAFFWSLGWFPMGSIFYLPTFFYVWAFLHVATSTRFADIRRTVSLS